MIIILSYDDHHIIIQHKTHDICYIFGKKRTQGYQIWHLRIISASSAHHQCIISASSVHHQCIISASLVHHQRIISASSVHHQCIISASSADHQCIICASSVHHQCISALVKVHMMIIRAQFLLPARGPNSRTCVLVYIQSPKKFKLNPSVKYQNNQ